MRLVAAVILAFVVFGGQAFGADAVLLPAPKWKVGQVFQLTSVLTKEKKTQRRAVERDTVTTLSELKVVKLTEGGSVLRLIDRRIDVTSNNDMKAQFLSGIVGQLTNIPLFFYVPNKNPAAVRVVNRDQLVERMDQVSRDIRKDLGVKFSMLPKGLRDNIDLLVNSMLRAETLEALATDAARWLFMFNGLKLKPGARYSRKSNMIIPFGDSGVESKLFFKTQGPEANGRRITYQAQEEPDLTQLSAMLDETVGALMRGMGAPGNVDFSNTRMRVVSTHVYETDTGWPVSLNRTKGIALGSIGSHRETLNIKVTPKY